MANQVLFISNCNPIASQGSGYVICGFKKILDNHGYHCQVYGPDSYEPLKFLGGKLRNLRLIIGMAMAVLKAGRLKNYHHVEIWGGQGCLATWLIKALSPKTLVVHHSNGIESHAASIMQQHQLPTYSQRLLNWFNAGLRRADAVITVSKFDADWLIKTGLKPADCVLSIDNALPNTEAVTNAPPTHSRPYHIMYIGTWMPRKGTNVVVQAINQHLTQHTQAQALLVGVGKAFRPTKHFKAEVTDRIKVIGFETDKQKVFNYYQQAKMVLVPSVYESFGMVTAEAQLSGCAVAATPTGYAASLSSNNGLVLPPNNPTQAVAKITALLNQPDQLQQIANNGRLMALNLRWDTSEKKYLPFLQLMKSKI